MTHSNTNPDVLLAKDNYFGATAEDLADTGVGGRAKAIINQRALFPRRGTATLYNNRLVLTGWDNADYVTLFPREIDSISNEFTELYGRFLGGGLKKAGAPVILHRTSGTEIYLLLNHRWFTERTDNNRWYKLLTNWLTTARNTDRGRH
ncbi:hypothetical protein [Streptomyces catenulae]|uniref:Uncharacterized protein n=1 Tax=Streptomyces catenulae TaxID=66875 RepID=A0ABV2YZQ0_9ACTN|nr:hypothetical protein [Streptomyces catenulae]